MYFILKFLTDFLRGFLDILVCIVFVQDSYLSVSKKQRGYILTLKIIETRVFFFSF